MEEEELLWRQMAGLNLRYIFSFLICNVFECDPPKIRSLSLSNKKRGEKIV
jgi:hypothetical protein